LSQSGRAKRHCSKRNGENFVPFAGGFIGEIVKPGTGESENDASDRWPRRNDRHLVGSVRSARPAGIRGGIGEAGGAFDYRNVTLKGLIMRTYGVKESQIAGPDWLDSDGYDIVATIPHNANEAQLPQMLQTLLAERFPKGRHIEVKSPIAELCDFLSGTLDRPVVDMTGLKAV
jgi:hypothetical protein